MQNQYQEKSRMDYIIKNCEAINSWVVIRGWICQELLNDV